MANVALQVEDYDAFSLQTRRSLGAPCNSDRKLALAAAFVCAAAAIA